MKKSLKDYDELLFITIKNHEFLKKSLKDDDELLFVCISVHFCTKACNKGYKNMQESVQKRAEKCIEQCRKALVCILNFTFYVKNDNSNYSTLRLPYKSGQILTEKSGIWLQKE